MIQAKNKHIKLDWDFIMNEGLYGKELEPDTYQLAVSNMLISTGHMFEKLDRGDSIRVPITRKFDNILANPPFGINGLKYDEFESPLKREYVPIKTDNAVSLFIQAIIYMLKINGKCAVVLPDGQDLFSKSNNRLVAIREYLLKTCDLKEIIYLPSGIFTYTSIKTCVFYFVKKERRKRCFRNQN
ncbi:putative type I restriction modification N-6 adenine specific methyltransferase domain protein [Organic Lake phycodnavirus 1]|nr:putative type I restriction modification N-6 adenine specific methyltransferase domain protein [Organic Lake phycodnavirus 1]